MPQNLCVACLVQVCMQQPGFCVRDMCQSYATAVWCMRRSEFLADSQALWQKRTAHEADVRQRRLQFQKEKHEHQLQAAGLWACVCVCVSLSVW